MNQFQTLKSDLTQSRIVDIDSTVIDDDEIIVKIESYAFTANNVTYGVAGDTTVSYTHLTLPTILLV